MDKPSKTNDGFTSDGVTTQQAWKLAFDEAFTGMRSNDGGLFVVSSF